MQARAQENLGLAAEHGFFFRRRGSLEWDQRSSAEEMSWKAIVEPILQQYTESTDGAFVEKKESALVWHYNAADPDFGSLQVAALLISCLCFHRLPLHGCPLTYSGRVQVPSC
jgi:trehalose 6-phosphate synthase/phosphatase